MGLPKIIHGVRVFAYGTLEFPEVMQALTGRTFPFAEGVLEGYERFLIRGAWFPGIVRASAGRVDGRLYSQVDGQSLRLIDLYEDDFYDRRTVGVRTPDGVRHVAETYVLPRGRRELLGPEPWNRERFRQQHLGPLLFLCQRFRQVHGVAEARP